VYIAGCASDHVGGDVDDGGAAGIDGHVAAEGRAPGDEGLDGGSVEAALDGGEATIEAGPPPADGSVFGLDEGADCGMAVIAGRVTVAGEGLENVEVCLSCSDFSYPRMTAVLTDGGGRYAEEISVPSAFFPVSSMGCEVTPRLYGYAFEPSSVFFTGREMCAGMANADFAASAIAPARNAAGSWEVVSYRCPTDPRLEYLCSPREPDGACGDRTLCPRETGAVLPFEQGCLFSEDSINCVDGNLYTEGSGVCEVSYPQRFSIDRNYEGEFDEGTRAWRITETTSETAMSSPTMGWTALPVSGELVLERVED